MRKGFTRKFEPLRILTSTQVEHIHNATLEVLEKTGVKLESERALKFLKDSGCDVNFETRVVKFPSYLVEESIRKSPSSFSVKARIPEDDLRISPATLYFMPAAGAKLHNEKTGELSVATLEQNNQGVLICDALETVDLQASYCPFFELKDIEPVMLLAESQASVARYTTKVSRGAQATDSFIREAQIANAVGKQLIGCIEGAAPLCFPEDAINAAFEYMDNGFPIWATGGSVMGGSSPATVAGATVSNNVETLAAITFIQCYKPGHSIIANDFVIPMDMESGNLFFGAIGSGYHQMAFNQVYRDLYRIPTCNAMAAFPNSKLIDYQNAFEKTHLAMSAALSGAIIIGSARLTYNFDVEHQLSMLDQNIAGQVLSRRSEVEDVKVTLENALTESKFVPIFIDLTDALPADAMGLIPSDFKVALDILEETLDLKKAVE